MNLASDAVRPQPHWELFDSLSEALCRGTAPVQPAIALATVALFAQASLEIYVAREVSPAVAAWRDRKPPRCPSVAAVHLLVWRRRWQRRGGVDDERGGGLSRRRVR